MSNIWHDINPRRISPEKFMAVIENTKSGKKKNEKGKEKRNFRLYPGLFTSTPYPSQYRVFL